MAQNNVGEQVMDAISAPYKKAISAIEKVAGTSFSTPAPSRTQSTGSLPSAWDAANKVSQQQHLGKKAVEPTHADHGAARRARMARKGYTK